MPEEKEMELAEQISILIRETLDNVKKFYGVEDMEEINARERRDGTHQTNVYYDS